MARPRRLGLGDALLMLLLAGGIMAYASTAAGRQTVRIDGCSATILGFDDVYVTLRYARHLASGQGFVWNVGEPPIEGFSSPPWLLWAAFLMKLDADPTRPLIMSAAACHALAVVLLYLTVRLRCGSGRLAALSAGAFIALAMPIGRQVVTGGEMPLLLLCLVAALHGLSPPDPPRAWGALFAGLLPLARPEGLLLTVLLLAYALHASRGRGLRLAALLVVLGVLPVVALTAWRLRTFGVPLPNSYYLKVWHRPGRLLYGVPYVRRFLESTAATPALAILIIAAARARRAWPLALAASIVATLLSVAMLGGDAWDHWRLLIPLLPLLVLLAAELTAHAGAVVRLVVWGWLAASAVAPLIPFIRSQQLFPVPRPASLENVRTGLLLSRICRPGAMTADFWAGATPYYADLPSIDMLGRSDAHVARVAPFRLGAAPGHDRIDVAYVLSRKPDVIVSHHRLGITEGEIAALLQDGLNPFGAVLLHDATFRRDYAPLPGALSERWHGIHVRRDSALVDRSAVASAEAAICPGPVEIAGTRGFADMDQDWLHSWRHAIALHAEILLEARTAARVALVGKLRAARPPCPVRLMLDGAPVADAVASGRFEPLPPTLLDLAAGPHVLGFDAEPRMVRLYRDKPPVGIALQDLELRLVEIQPGE